ncbi:hypothetical protein [Ensifer soli]|uniref:hypothetical protein n=1 Tax=Ciceribacter sp. sgz301302 TaxID=3342379 RepID=UPI0035BB0A2B
MRHSLALFVPLLAAVPLAPARASSDDAWAAFRADVSKACIAAVGDQLYDPTAVVDPTGSEHYGLALVSGTPKGASGTVSHICVYDKQTKAAEVGSEIPAEELPASGEAAAPSP